MRIKPSLMARRQLVSALSVVHFSIYIETNKNIPMTNQPKKRGIAKQRARVSNERVFPFQWFRYWKECF